MGDNLGPVPLQDFLVDFAAVDQGTSPQWLVFFGGWNSESGGTLLVGNG